MSAKTSAFSVSSVLLLGNGESTIYESTDAALNSVPNAALDVNLVLSDVEELSIWRKISHNENALCLHEDPRRVLRKLQSFVSCDVL